MNHKKYTKFVGDFETTIYEGQEYTEVWASALVEFHSDKVIVFGSIQETIDYLKNIPGHVQVYYHNLKFDGEFWLSFLERNGYKKALVGDDEFCEVIWKKEKDMLTNEYKYFISDRGLWYYIVIKTNKGFIEIRDSLKLLPFSVEEIAKGFNTKAKKLSMEYTKFRYAGCPISEEEKRYIANDVLIVKEALEFMEQNGKTRLTIGSCCFDEFKHQFSNDRFYNDFPNIYELTLNKDKYGSENAGEYIRRAYHGGWCYVKKAVEGKTIGAGCTIDVNGLYSAVMHSNSGNIYPIGIPTFWSGNYIPDEAIGERKYYFIRIRTRFYLKPGHLPFIHIKGTWLYKGSENLESSDLYYAKDGSYYKRYTDFSGEIVEAIPTLTMTMTDYQLFLEHYDVEDFEILDGCYFQAKKSFFDAYIDKYASMKEKAETPAIRTESKLFLNNLYGKMATSPSSAFKVGELNQDGSLSYYISLKAGRMPGYIPVGAAITSYARNVTIRAAQANYDRFCYADTDSLHCSGSIEDLEGIELDQKALGKWKHEADFEEARFIKQKTYIERSGKEYIIRCAGMPKKSKELFAASITRDFDEKQLTDEEKEFLEEERTIEDFKRGLKVPGRVKPKRIPGGVILVPCSFEIR